MKYIGVMLFACVLWSGSSAPVKADAGKLFDEPLYSEFLSRDSNYDPQRQHPAQWEGQYWDPTHWNDNWSVDKTIARFFQAKIFHAQYIETAEDKDDHVTQTPVLELGPKFWVLSDLDRRRVLKLFADHSGVFANGYNTFILRDWHTRDIVGSVTPRGMYLL